MKKYYLQLVITMPLLLEINLEITCVAKKKENKTGS